MTRVGDWEIVVISGRDGMYATTTTLKYGTYNKHIKLQHLHQTTPTAQNYTYYTKLQQLHQLHILHQLH